MHAISVGWSQSAADSGKPAPPVKEVARLTRFPLSGRFVNLAKWDLILSGGNLHHPFPGPAPVSLLPASLIPTNTIGDLVMGIL
jgi:hypothetical protein